MQEEFCRSHVVASSGLNGEERWLEEVESAVAIAATSNFGPERFVTAAERQAVDAKVQHPHRGRGTP